MDVELARHRFTVDEYHRMGEVGILAEDDRVELVDGEIVHMTPIGPRHVVRVAALHRRLQVLLEDRADIIVQSPIRLGPHHEPQPDVTLLRPPLSRYEARLAGPGDVLLVVEVADTSAVYDRGVKLPLYAAAGIPEVWLVDLAGEAVEVYRAPAATGYRDARRLVRGDRVAPGAFPDASLAVDEVLG